MRKVVAQFSVLFAVLKPAAAALIATVTATSALADMRNNLSCTLDKYLPTGNTRTDTLRGWVPERIRIEIWENNDVKVYFPSGRVAHGEVKRENSNKIAMEVTRGVSDHIGRKTFMTYTLEWFKSNNKIFVDVSPQGYNPLGGAKGNCKATSSQGRAFGSALDIKVCTMATKNGVWEQQRSLQKWVLEAQERALTLEDCERVLKVN